MRYKPTWSVAIFLLLASCGTLKIDIDLGEVSPTAVSTTPSAVTRTGTPVSTPTASPTACESTATPEQAAPTPEKILPIALAAGRNFTCVVMHSGGVKCWGNNEHGQLGNGTRVNSNEPVDASGLTDVKALTAGWGHVCALTGGGAVKCWGYNANGELGDGRTTDSAAPVDVTGLGSDVEAIDAGDDHTCAVIRGGGLRCWGINTYGQLGDWTKVARSVPVDSPWFGGGVADVQAGWGHTCVRTTAGWAKCWGNNEYGQLGFGKLTDIHLPAEDVVNLSGKILDVTADGGQTCALIAGGGAYCWGNNRYGQLGDGTTQKQYAPVAVAGLSTGVSLLKTGWNHTCAVVSGGELRCWGWNYFGQLGEGTTLNRYTPARVQNLTDGVKDIALGWGHTCVVTDLGTVKCWGSNESGQLGDGTWADSKVPLTVIGLPPVMAPTEKIEPSQTPTAPDGVTPSTLTYSNISAGVDHTCGVTTQGGVKCWGDNSSGELGDRTKADRTIPVDVAGLSSGALAVEAGGYYSCALIVPGNVMCWGRNASGQLGNGTTVDSLIPVKVEGLPAGIRSIAAGDSHACALTSDAEVMCWGRNANGALGNGMRADSGTPVKVAGIADVEILSISAGAWHTCALTSGGAVVCWGFNTSGQLGDGSNDRRLSPVDVVGLSDGASAVSAGIFRTCAIVQAGGVKCWGMNLMEDGVYGSHRVPVSIIQLTGVAIGIAVGNGHTCVLLSAGGVQCWGSNHDGYLGNGTTVDSWVPVDVLGLHGRWKAISAGNDHTCVLAADGVVLCWGVNHRGQLGDGTTVNRHFPVGLAGAPAIPTATSATRPTPTITDTLTATPTT